MVLFQRETSLEEAKKRALVSVASIVYFFDTKCPVFLIDKFQ